MDCHINYIRCIDRQVDFTKDTIPLLGSAMDETKIEGLESMKDSYSKQSTNIPTKKMSYYLDIVRYKFDL